MHEPFLPNSDISGMQPKEADRKLYRQLEKAASKCFYEACDSIAQDALFYCQWHIAIKNNIPTLTIICPDPQSYWQIIIAKQKIANNLTQIMSNCKICIYPPRGMCLEVEIKETLMD